MPVASATQTHPPHAAEHLVSSGTGLVEEGEMDAASELVESDGESGLVPDGLRCLAAN